MYIRTIMTSLIAVTSAMSAIDIFEAIHNKNKEQVEQALREIQV